MCCGQGHYHGIFLNRIPISLRMNLCYKLNQISDLTFITEQYGEFTNALEEVHSACTQTHARLRKSSRTSLPAHIPFSCPPVMCWLRKFLGLALIHPQLTVNFCVRGQITTFHSKMCVLKVGTVLPKLISGFKIYKTDGTEKPYCSNPVVCFNGRK